MKIPETKKYNLSYLKKLVTKCKCGSFELIFDNLRGWTGITIRCKNCKNRVYAETIEEAIDKWNKENECQ